MNNVKDKKLNDKSSMITALTVSFLLITQTAHADFRKALDAYQKRDGATMLKEVKDAVDKKNDDGIILFVGILKQYPKIWQSTLDSSQQAELFSNLEKITSHSSLQSQYRLAVISRTNDYPKPNSLEASQEELALIHRLEPVASKGYAPAAMALYSAYAFPIANSDKQPEKIINKNPEKAMNWLIKAAESGSTQGAFVLGMKLLNITDNKYGCNDWKPSVLICPSKDEAKGWLWMQQAAMQANERNIMLGDFAYEMGGLYRQGVAGNKPDYEQAYLWYVFGIDKVSHISTSGYGSSDALNYKINQKIAEMQKMGELEIANQQLDNVWTNTAERSRILASENQRRTPRLFGQKDKKIKDKPVFSKYEANGAGKIVDVYADGRINFTHDQFPTDVENSETYQKVKSKKVKEFLNKMTDMGFYNVPLTNYESFSDEVGLSSVYLLTTRNNKTLRNIFRYNSGTYYDAILDRPLANYLALAEKYFPTAKLNCNLSPNDLLQKKCLKFYDELNTSSNTGKIK